MGRISYQTTAFSKVDKQWLLVTETTIVKNTAILYSYISYGSDNNLPGDGWCQDNGCQPDSGIRWLVAEPK